MVAGTNAQAKVIKIMMELALRQWRKAPVFAAVALLTLAPALGSPARRASRIVMWSLTLGMASVAGTLFQAAA
ncbi:MAG TPA: hypothetical protein VIC54_10545 [Terriglobales bacterium]